MRTARLRDGGFDGALDAAADSSRAVEAPVVVADAHLA